MFIRLALCSLLIGKIAFAQCPQLDKSQIMPDITNETTLLSIMKYKRKINELQGLCDELSSLGINKELNSFFIDQIRHLEENKGRLPVPPKRIRYPVEDYLAFQKYLKKLYLRRTAFQLYLDENDKLPWKLIDYNRRELQDLFSFKRHFKEGFTWSYIDFIESPDEVFLQQSFVDQNQKKTIKNMFNFIRENVIHRTTVDRNAPYNEQFEVKPPHYIHEYLEGGAIGSCGINGAFLCSIAHSANIPCSTDSYSAKGTNLHGHTYIDFPAQKMYMSHGDNPYSRNLKKVFFEEQEREEFLSIFLEDPKKAEAIWQARKE